MTTFDEREKAFEALYVHEQDFAFRARARRDRRIGAWAAELLGKTSTQAEDYAAEIIARSIKDGGAEAVARQIEADLAAGGVAHSAADIRHRMEAILTEVVAQMKVE